MLNVELVPLRQEHKSLLYRWRNDPYIISRSGTGKGVAREEHDRWFDRLMQSANTLAYVIEIDGQSAGHLRMERDADGLATISMYLLERFTGAGAGTDAIRLGCSRVALAWPGTSVKAIVLSENMPIRKALTKAGFVTIRVDSEHAEMCWYGAEVKATIERFSSRLAEFGAGHRALDWGSEAGQRRRFEMLAAIGIGDGAAVLDVGCGLGDFNSWLIRAGRDVRYTGLDVTPALLERAAASHPDSEFVLASILDTGVLEGRSFDYVVASGLFYTYRSGGYDWMRAAIEAMWARTGRGLAFNSLSAWATEAESGEFHADPGEVLALCRKLSPWLDVYHTYHPRDFTVHMLRDVRR